MHTRHILFCSSEVHPVIKTGGLADVSGSLPRALVNMGVDVRVIIPGYQSVKNRLPQAKPVLQTHIDGYTVQLLQSRLPGTRVKLYLVDCPELFDRPGNPYLDTDGSPWPDNAERFALFCRIIEKISLNQLELDWQPEVVHLNDWQTGLAAALIAQYKQRPGIVFTIHNLAYQGNFDYATFEKLGLPAELWHFEKLEYHNQFSFMKAGIVYADRINTVSPTYASEIQTARFGSGMEGVLQHRAGVLSGILNGIDTDEWNPGTDSHLASKYNIKRLPEKIFNKRALQQKFKLPAKDKILLIGLVSRLVDQKGIDIIIAAMPKLMQASIQLIILGSGDKQYEQGLQKLAQQYPQQLGVSIGYNETLAHLIEGGCDAFLMPSRFEPCGLNQLYSLHYGTLPIVSAVGGLADTVVDISTHENGNGFVMPQVNEAGLILAIRNAVNLYANQASWMAAQQRAMKQDHSWKASAEAYLALYQQANQNLLSP